MIRTSEQLGDLFDALAQIQGEIDHAHKDSANPFFHSKYADLTSIIDATRPAMTKHGVCITQWPSLYDGTVLVVTRLGHKSGQWMELEAGAIPKMLDPQSVGSTITYLRRYAWQSVLGLGAEDDDGNAATFRQDNGQKEKAKPQRSEASDAEPEMMTQKQAGAMWAKANQLWADDAKDRLHQLIADRTGKTSSKQVTKQEASVLIDEIGKQLGEV